jgi:Ran GTPase-activating protein (RanGAP) involved in mRNA processing and transport
MHAKWPCLTALNLQGNHIENEGVDAICQGKFGNLITLNMSGNSFSKNALRVNSLSNAAWRNITYLKISLKDRLSCYRISRIGIKRLVEANNPSLRYLWMEGCFIDDEGVIELSKASWRNLISL